MMTQQGILSTDRQTIMPTTFQVPQDTKWTSTVHGQELRFVISIMAMTQAFPIPTDRSRISRTATEGSTTVMQITQNLKPTIQHQTLTKQCIIHHK